MPDHPPEAIVRAAAECGYDAVGLTLGNDWSDADTRDIRRLLESSHLDLLDVEVIWIQPGVTAEPAHDRLIAIGGELGARHVLIVSNDPDRDHNLAAFEHLARRAQDAGMLAVLEFLMITEIRSLAAALDIVRTVDHPAGAVLVDSLHLDRCGDAPRDLLALPDHLIPYVQLCDGPAAPAGQAYADYLRDAVDDRSIPGEGELPLGALLGALKPGTPLSLEIRSLELRRRYPDPVRRAGRILNGTRAFLDSLVV